MCVMDDKPIAQGTSSPMPSIMAQSPLRSSGNYPISNASFATRGATSRHRESLPTAILTCCKLAEVPILLFLRELVDSLGGHISRYAGAIIEPAA